ncbi:MAG: hypothetical protein WCQ48_02930 [Chloroflexota bacterium]
MFGYEPGKSEPKPGSWGETLLLVRLALGAIGVPLLFIGGILTLFIATVVLFFVHPYLAIVPVAGLAAASWHLIRRERLQVEEEIRALPPRYK